METANLLRTVISNSRWTNAAGLIQLIKDIAIRLVNAQPVEFAVGNMIRRVLHLIREEFKANTTIASAGATATQGTVMRHGNLSTASFESFDSSGTHGSPMRHQNDSNMFNMLADPLSTEGLLDYNKPCYQLKQAVIMGIQDIIDELDTLPSNLSAQALEHIHADEIIMTHGRSKSVENFLLGVAKVRRFQVMVAEAAPSYGGHELAANLAKAGISTLVVSDAAVFALMARVNKVIIGCHAVTANGGLIAPSGSMLMAAAARHHATPVFVVTGLYKLTPVYPENHDHFNLFGSPDPIVPFADGSIIEDIDAVNPFFDYVPPDLVNLFVTNAGGHPASYIYRLLTELYDPEDYELVKSV